MNEKTLRNVSTATAVIGLIMLFFISQNLETKTRDIDTITTKDIGNSIKACGEVSEKTTSKAGHSFLKLRENNAEIKVVIFNSTAQVLKKEIDVYSIKKHDSICISGEVNQYKGELEIICNKIEFRENVF